MKRLVLAALLLSAGAIGAHADNDIYKNTLKQRAATMPCTPTARSATPGSARRRTAR
jgi:hypothetical protein